MRIFVGGLSWDTTERRLEDAFSRFGKVVEAQGEKVIRFGIQHYVARLFQAFLPVVGE